ncbi:MAG: hypothetical protein MUO63_21130 [Desulfobulbaceae bacterium]|nr:hypothetical protein [Desulfobulbaceae bacterium]
MNPDARIIILGTSHPLQCGNKKCSEEQNQEFLQLLEQICVGRQIKCIVEEMNSEGLENHDVKNTVAYTLSQKLNLKHQYTDLSIEHIADLCIHIDSFMFREPTDEMRMSKRELLHRHLLNPIRERYWLANILNLNTWPTLFICGSDHINNMIDLINLLEYGPVVSLVRY